MGVPGLLLCAVFFLTTRGPGRHSAETSTTQPLGEVIAYFRHRWRLYLGLFLGAGGVNLIVFAYGAWAPELFRRTYGWSISQAGFAFGATGIIAAAAGTITFTMLAEFLRKRGRRDGLVLAALLASLTGCTAAIAAPLAPEASQALIGIAIMIFALSGCSNLAVVSVQFIAPGEIRATAIALLFMCTTMIGLGLGPPVVAMLSEGVFSGTGGLAPALSLLAGMTLPLSAGLVMWSRQPYIQQVSRPEQWVRIRGSGCQLRTASGTCSVHK